ncbi:ATP-binding protein [Streptomyces violaceusniger]|uniref:ATP-binding protein n=1 Tax=Streptomyces violaceusniger TaxID=68280 RepID=UPI001387278D
MGPALLEQHLSAGATVFLDSTNAEPHVRAGLVERARRHGRPVVAGLSFVAAAARIAVSAMPRTSAASYVTPKRSRT